MLATSKWGYIRKELSKCHLFLVENSLPFQAIAIEHLFLAKIRVEKVRNGEYDV